MPLQDKKTSGLMVALGDMSSDEASDSDDMSSAKQRAAKDMMRALASKDASAFSAALERHYAACGMGQDDEAY